MGIRAMVGAMTGAVAGALAPSSGGDSLLEPFSGTDSDILTALYQALASVTIAAPKWTANDASAAIFSGVTHHYNADATGKYYMEAEWTAAAAGAGLDMMGFRAGNELTNVLYEGLTGGVIWNDGDGVWEVLSDIDTPGVQGIETTNTTGPRDGERVGVAVNQVTRKFYAHVGGVWLTDGVNGGNPDDDNGWTIDAADATLYEWAGTTNSGLQMTFLDGTELLPTGYTRVT